MMKVSARSLLRYTTDQLLENLAGEFILVLDDGEIDTNAKEVIYSSYIWDIHRVFPDTPLLLENHVKSVTKGKRIEADSHLQLLNGALWGAYDTYKLQGMDRHVLLDQLSKLVYVATNKIHNSLSYALEEHVSSLDILDFIAIGRHPKVIEAINKMEISEQGVAAVNAGIFKFMTEDPQFADNQLANAVKGRIVKVPQALQCLGPRGFMTDIDSHRFPIPIQRSYLQGFRSLHDSMLESRASAISLIFSTDPLQQSEYFSRRQQLICQNVKTLHLGDCGSQHYQSWPVREALYQNGAKLQTNDLDTLAGKYYLDEETNTLKVVRATDKHLIGKTIKLRSVIAGCNHPDPTGVCEVCYGETGASIPANSNLGHSTCVVTTSMLGQLILSTKHYIGSSVIEGINLRPDEKKYLSTGSDGNSYHLNKDLANKAVKIIISAEQARGLADLNFAEDIQNLNITRVSSLSEIIICVKTEKIETQTTMAVMVNDRLSNMSYPMLQHIKEHGWEMNNSGGYIIDMAGWDYTKPILVLPMRHFNMSNHQTIFRI